MSLQQVWRLHRFWLLCGMFLAAPCFAQLREFELSIQNHLFSPSTLYVPAGEKVRIRLINLDESPEEFESFALNREKVVLGGSEAVVYIGPLKVGEYPFSGEYNPDTARGLIIALPLEQFLARQSAQASSGPAATPGRQRAPSMILDAKLEAVHAD